MTLFEPAYVFDDTPRARRQLIRNWPLLRECAVDSATGAAEFADLVLDVIGPYEWEKPLRGYMRRYFPSGRRGFVAQDIDLVIRRYGPSCRLDKWGKVRLIELKWDSDAVGSVCLDPAQECTFGLVNRLLRSSPLAGCHYEGFFVVTHDNPQPLDGRVWVKQLGRDREPLELAPGVFEQWLRGDIDVDLWSGVK